MQASDVLCLYLLCGFVFVFQSITTNRRRGRMRTANRPSQRMRPSARKVCDDLRASSWPDQSSAKMWVVQIHNKLWDRNQTIKMTKQLTDRWEETCSVTQIFCWLLFQLRYGSLKIKSKKRPTVSSANYAPWPESDTHSRAACWLVDNAVSWPFTLLTSFLPNSSKTSSSERRAFVFYWALRCSGHHAEFISEL